MFKCGNNDFKSIIASEIFQSYFGVFCKFWNLHNVALDKNNPRENGTDKKDMTYY